MNCSVTDQLCMFLELVHEVTERPEWVRVMYSIIMLATFVVGVCGNLLTCVVIYCDRSMHTATNCYLFNLAVSDILLAFGILFELNVFSNYSIDNNKYGDSACRAHFFSVGALWNNGVLIMTALAIERYIAVWHPLLLNRRLVWRGVMKIIYIIWTVAILEALPEIWTVRFVKTKTSAICFIVPTPFARLLNGILGLVTFVVPLVTMIFLYAMVAFKVNVTQKNNPVDKIFNHQKTSSKVNRLIVALTLSFLVCWVPYFFLRVLIVLADWQNTQYIVKHWDVVLMVTGCAGWFNITLNPFLFSLMSTKFRKAFKALWNTKIRKLDSVPRTRNAII